MNNDLKILLRKISIFSIPILLWIATVIIIDPFNYFNISNVISEKSKEKSAQRLNSLLFNSIKFKNNPVNNIIIGDSRIRKLPTKRIKELTNNDYFTFHSNAAKLNEIIDLFWLANEHEKLENVIIGINFNLYNEFAYSNRVSDVKELINNPLIYIFNWNIVETVYLAIKNEIFGITKNKKRNKASFWEHTITTIADNHYSKWKYPKNTVNKLKEMSEYCHNKNINLTFIIVPHHNDFKQKVIEYNLADKEVEFKSEIKTLAKTIDFDFSNEITRCNECFSDPIHTTDSISTIIVEDIFREGEPIIGKLLQ